MYLNGSHKSPPRSRNDRMIHENVLKSPTQHLTYRPHHLVDVRKRDGDGGRGPQSSDKNGEVWTALNGFSTLYYEDISPLFHSRPTCTDTSLSAHYPPHGVISLTLYYSHKAFSTEPCRCSHSHRQPDHILTFQQTSLIIILGAIELKSSLNWVCLSNQVSTIKIKQLLTQLGFYSANRHFIRYILFLFEMCKCLFP